MLPEKIFTTLHLPASQGTATYNEADWRRATSGWHAATYCAMPVLFELESDRAQKDMFGPEVMRPMHEMSLLDEAIRQMNEYQIVSDAPRPSEVGERKGRFAR
jgi:hypothetical protein